jgi:tetratricopeptide (TPR) repeat protein
LLLFYQAAMRIKGEEHRVLDRPAEPDHQQTSALSAEPDRQESPAWPSGWQITICSGLVLLLAFVLASFPARDSEVWRHLATGRAFLDGTYTLGSDPFAYTTQGITWINHAWLYDVVLYAIYQCTGQYLVIVNSLLAVCIAGLMLLTSRVRASPWSGSLAVALALVAIAPHLTMVPAVVSYLLCAFTLWWLKRSEDGPGPVRLFRQLPLFLALILWANCDEWFLLGPLAIAWYWLGNLLSGRESQRGMVGAFVVSVAACLINAHHLAAFMLPSGLGTSVLAPQTTSSPLRGLSLTSLTDVPVPLIAYFVLLILGMRAFVASAASRSWSWDVLWLALLCLSLYRSAAIPFFAIAAGPILARNWQNAERPVPRRLRRLAPIAATMVLLTVVALACPGWVQGSFEQRGWHLSPNASLERIARRIDDWHRTGKLDEKTCGFQFSIDVAHYIEWLCPQEKVFLDSRANLFQPETVAEFQEVRHVLSAESTAAAAKAGAARSVLRQWKVTHLVVADPADRVLTTALLHLWHAADEWYLVGLDGRATVWAAAERLVWPPVDFSAAAFDPATMSTAPRQWSGREPEPRPWWDVLAWPGGAGDLDRDEALVDLVHFEALRLTFFIRNRAAWEAEVIAGTLAATTPPAAGISGLGGCVPLSLFAAYRIPTLSPGLSSLNDLISSSISAHMRNRDDGPAGSLLLAVRAARRALAVDPDDALAYFRLGWAYAWLHQLTSERGTTSSFSLLTQLRRVQAITALKNAVRLRPDLAPAHELLAGLYQEARALDLALPHVQELLRLTRAAGPRSGETAQQFDARVRIISDREQALGKQMRELLNLVDTQSFNLKIYGKVRLAESRGLPGHALKLLQDPRSGGYEEFGVEGALIELHLMLYTGATREVREWITPAQEAVMEPFNYHWLLALLGAATGDYDQADDDLRRMILTPSDLPELRLHNVGLHESLALLLLQGGPLDAWQPLAVRVWLMRRLEALARQHADVRVLRGMLALESGEIEAARRRLREALAMWNGNEGSAVIGRHYVRLLRSP